MLVERKLLRKVKLWSMPQSITTDVSFAEELIVTSETSVSVEYAWESTRESDLS